MWNLQPMKNLQRCLEFKSTGILRRVYWYSFTDVSKKRSYSTFQKGVNPGLLDSQNDGTE
jgi:hypothetical protein